MKDDPFKALLKNIVISTIGGSGNGIVDLLYGKKNINEFLIAKKLGLTINQTRNVLYKLADEGLVSFIRKKDSKKGGWYTYFWTLNSGKSLIKFRDSLNKSIENLQQQVDLKKMGRFYTCDNCHMEYNEESALINNYSCPECGEVLKVKDNADEVKGLERDLNKLKEVLSRVEVEIGILTIKEDKARGRRIKAETKKKMKERAVKRAKNKAIKIKELKRTGKFVKKVAKKKKKI